MDLIQVASFKGNMLVLNRSRVIERDMKLLDYVRKSETNTEIWDTEYGIWKKKEVN